MYFDFYISVHMHVMKYDYVTSCYSKFRLQLYSILKSDWSGTWLLLPIDATYREFYYVYGHCGRAEPS